MTAEQLDPRLQQVRICHCYLVVCLLDDTTEVTSSHKRLPKPATALVLLSAVVQMLSHGLKLIELLVGRQGPPRGAQVHTVNLSDCKEWSQGPSLPRLHLKVITGRIRIS